jgi:hypothetical protein
MSHPRTADLRVMPLVILLKELNSWKSKEKRTMRIEYIKQNNIVRKNKIIWLPWYHENGEHVTTRIVLFNMCIDMMKRFLN